MAARSLFEMLRDGFVFGVLDDTLKERLLRENELNLTKAVEIAQRQESSKKQIKDMSSKASINAVSKGQRPQHNLRHGNDTKSLSAPAVEPNISQGTVQLMAKPVLAVRSRTFSPKCV